MKTHAPQVKIIRLVTGDYQVNTYIVYCPETRHGVIIDPGGSPKKILSEIHNHRLTIDSILNTHGHADHGLANKDMQTTLAAPVCLHEDDDLFFADPEVRIQVAILADE